MEIFVGFVIGVVSTLVICAFSGYGEDLELMNQLKEEKKQNKSLRKDLDNAELRTNYFARIIKRIEDIVNSKDTMVNKFDKIKELFDDDQSK